MRLTRARVLLFSLILLASNIPLAHAAFTPRTETYVNLSSLTTPFNIVVNKPSGTVDGDILFCWIGWYAATTIDSVPSGWNLLGQYIANTDRYALYYKVANGEPSSWTWSFAATVKVRAVCSAYTSGNFNGANPINVVSNTAYRTSDTSCRAASMSVTSPNSPLIFWGGIYSTSSKTFTKPTVPTSGWVEDDDAGSTTPDFWTEVCSMIWASSGDTGIMSATITALSTKHAFAVALNPPTASEYSRSASQSLTWADTVTQASDFIRSAAQSMIWASTVSKAIDFGREVTQIIGLAGTASKTSEFIRSSMQSMNLMILTQRTLDFGRAAAQMIGWSSRVSISLDYVRVVVQSILWNGTITRVIGIGREVQQTLNTVLGGARTANLFRSAAQSIASSFGAWGGMGGLYNATASLILYIKTRDPPLIVVGSPINLLGIVVGVFIFLTLMLYRRRG